MENSYAGVMEAWKVELIVERARRAGFREQDLDEAVQHVVVGLLDFQFDLTKANGAAEPTAFTAAADHQLAKLCRKETRHRRRVMRHLLDSGKAESSPAPEADLDLVIDLECAVAQLSELERKICAGLATEKTVTEIARECRVSWPTIKDHIEKIRQRFAHAGLGDLQEARKEAA